MTLGDRICQALRLHLIDQSLDELTEVQAGIEASPTEAYASRVICATTSCSERAAHLKGVFNVTGNITIRQSIDESGAEASFRTLCDQVKSLAGDETATPAGIEAADDSITIYNRSWHLDSQQETAGELGFQAIFSWRAVARDTPTTS